MLSGMTLREDFALLGEVYAQPWRELYAHLKAANTPLEGLITFAQYRRSLCALCGYYPKAIESRYCSSDCAEDDYENRAIA